MLNEKFAFCFKITIKWNLTKSHATRLKSAKYKTRVIKEQLDDIFALFSSPDHADKFKEYLSSKHPNINLASLKLSVILRSECVNTREFLHSLGIELKEIMILPLKNTFYSAITHLILKISQFLLPTTTTLRLR